MFTLFSDFVFGILELELLGCGLGFAIWSATWVGYCTSWCLSCLHWKVSHYVSENEVKHGEGWGCSPVIEPLPRMGRAKGLLPSTIKTRQKVRGIV